ncbi:hypothetical protein [Streptomyces yangpuensis]|uniref:hypothetical protein n=1 Tax=Streptomyces yangpuensis TaxID=1648182 RepID=UPI00365FA342
MSTAITVPTFNPDQDETYKIDTRPGPYGMHHGIVTNPLLTITGDPLALQALGRALIDAADVAFFATTLRVDRPGPLQNLTGEPIDLSGQTPEQAIAHEGWANTVLVWATAGDDQLPVTRSDWIGNADDTAAAQLDDTTDLHFADGLLQAGSRCSHGHRHHTTLTHPDQLAGIRREAADCPGHEEPTA